MNAHDRFESLAGAVMLGEATAHERATFDAHAATCAECGADANDGAFVAARIAGASASERWLPAQPIVERLRTRRSARARTTLGALGWAVALSLVLNVAFVSGIGAQFGGAFAPAAPADSAVASTPISLEVARPAHAAPPLAATGARRARLAVRLRAPHRHHMATPVLAARGTRASEAHEPTLDDVPDLLAGIDLYGDGTPHRAVAAAAIPRCVTRDDDAPSVRPCRDATGRLER